VGANQLMKLLTSVLCPRSSAYTRLSMMARRALTAPFSRAANCFTPCVSLWSTDFLNCWMADWTSLHRALSVSTSA
jgi:hypothetical protein